ncbi:MAG TPA: hypothetical protein ENK57_25340, partial [Polyangiaceae bacterium]|nr:hypothetical protein [Polyangiaceae bacterium]
MRDGTPGVETRTKDGLRCFTLPLSAVRRKPVVRITPPPQPEAATEPKRRPARVAQMLAFANDLQGKLDRGEHQDLATLARQMGISRSRLTRLLDLALLAPDIQEQVLFLEAVDGKEPVTERALREVVRHA